MRITVDLDEADIEKIRKATGTKKASAAVRQALRNYLMQLDRHRFLKGILDGASGYSATNEELESMGTYDAD
ncbi:MAG: type II toxin-antitoxin system VapB family antitoxin [Planctomycetota bacterium]|nr:type II toxin-antitoxin system VapB family antitoxin [Planctomycetota bacterium]